MTRERKLMEPIFSKDGELLTVAPGITIRLHDYSGSKCWIGYTESQQLDDIPGHINAVLDRLQELPAEVIIVTSQRWVEIEGFSFDEHLSGLHKLAQARWLTHQSEAEWDAIGESRGLDPWDEGIMREAFDTRFDRFVDKSSAQVFRENLSFLIRVLCREFSLRGHLFLHWPTAGVVAYPHDDGGLGFFAEDRVADKMRDLVFQLPGACLFSRLSTPDAH